MGRLIEESARLALFALVACGAYLLGDRPDYELRRECRAMAASTYSIVTAAREIQAQTTALTAAVAHTAGMIHNPEEGAQ